MKPLEYWDILFRNHAVPCCVSDLKSDILIYANKKLVDLLPVGTEYLGIPFDEVITNSTMLPDGTYIPKKCGCSREKLYVQTHIYDYRLQANFEVAHTKISFQGEEYLFTEYVPLKEEHKNNFDFEITMNQCLSALKEDSETRVSELLKILGKHYDSEKAYLFQIDSAGEEIYCLHAWLKSEEMSYVRALSRSIEIEKILTWLKERNEMNILEIDSSLGGISYDALGLEILEAFHIHNLIFCVIEDENKQPLGMLGVSNRDNRKTDFRLIQAIASFMKPEICQTEVDSNAVQQVSDLDMLTGFYSRLMYSKKVDALHDTPPKSLGVVFANVNGLKLVNGEFGYAKGDSYIKKATDVLSDYFKTDFYRISGDEFISFFENVEKEEFESLVLGLQQNRKGEQNFFALGHAWGSGRVKAEDLISEADTVMYINKQEYYHNSDRSFQDIKDSTLSDLLSYLANDEFMIYLQPQVFLHDGSLYGAEALIRRYDKTNQKMVFPDQFIPLYEKKSVIRHVDIFVVEQVCALLRRLADEGKKMFPISVNLSRVTLLEFGIVDTVAAICDKFSVPRTYVVIEVTERVGLIENEVGSSLVREFKDKGFKISLDDFGCAYSNIVTLAQIDVDEVKLDKSLVDDVTTNKKNEVLVENVLRMCNNLGGVSTLAEGIEYQEQGDLLHRFHCHLGQGYYYSRPIPVDEFVEKYLNEDED